MTYENYLDTFCSVLQARLVNRIPVSRRKKFMATFKEAREEARKMMDETHLPTIVGKRNAKRVLQKMKEGQL